MRLVVISDTHGDHEQLGVLDGDVLVHCGDAERSSHSAAFLQASGRSGRSVGRASARAP